ncbi:MAG: glutamate-5-semialdehyde dehydrogenase [Chloroflexi bacterium]|nr:glutamate-5-semialdehyde dehydrogenase [Chloroflexota bacterium]
MGSAARVAAEELGRCTADQRDAALRNLATALNVESDRILAANDADLAAARADGLDEHVAERMMLNADRIADMASAVISIADLDDPVGEVLEERRAYNGMLIRRVRVPLGVIGVIYESRPNITIDIAALCLKAGNAVILRGGKEAIRTNSALASLARESVVVAGLPVDSVQFVETTDRALVGEMLEMDDCIDLLVPRGSSELVHMVAERAKMPAVTGGIGVCHAYVDASADIDKAVDVVFNAKAQRHTVCNALDTLLVHENVAGPVLNGLSDRLSDAGVEVRADNRAWALLGPKRRTLRVKRAGEDDFGTEFLALILSVKVVRSIDEALEHIRRYGSGHSEAVIADDTTVVERFLNEVDASAVFANASTRFNDGGEFGLGAEVAISTNKLHARGPMGIREIMSYKWVVIGDGHVRT